jgi:hypothetical protein
MSNPPKSRILPPIYFGGAILSMAALHFLFPWPQWPDLVWQVAGACLLLVGIVVILVSAKLFEQHHYCPDVEQSIVGNTLKRQR